MQLDIRDHRADVLRHILVLCVCVGFYAFFSFVFGYTFVFDQQRVDT